MTTNFKIKVKERKVHESDYYTSADDAKKFVMDESSGILYTIAEICAQTADASIEDVRGKKNGPEILDIVQGDAEFAYKEYAESIKDLVVRMARRFAMNKIDENKRELLVHTRGTTWPT